MRESRKRVSQRLPKLISKMGVSKMVLGTKSYLHYKPETYTVLIYNR